MKQYSIYIAVGLLIFILLQLILASSIANKKFVEKEQEKGKNVELKGEPFGAMLGTIILIGFPATWYLTLNHLNTILKQNTNPYYVYGIYFMLFAISVLEIVLIRKSKVDKVLKFITYSVSSLMIIFIILLVGLRLYIFYHLSA